MYCGQNTKTINTEHEIFRSQLAAVVAVYLYLYQPLGGQSTARSLGRLPTSPKPPKYHLVNVQCTLALTKKWMGNLLKLGRLVSIQECVVQMHESCVEKENFQCIICPLCAVMFTYSSNSIKSSHSNRIIINSQLIKVKINE